MSRNITAGYSANAQRGWFSSAIGGAWRLVKQSIALPLATTSPLYAELCSLVAPHLSVLVYKRAKHSEQSSAVIDARWSVELDEFVSRMLWPYLADSPLLEGRSKCNIAEMLDAVIAAEQCAALSNSAINVPCTSRFDTSWAT